MIEFFLGNLALQSPGLRKLNQLMTADAARHDETPQTYGCNLDAMGIHEDMYQCGINLKQNENGSE